MEEIFRARFPTLAFQFPQQQKAKKEIKEKKNQNKAPAHSLEHRSGRKRVFTLLE